MAQPADTQAIVASLLAAGVCGGLPTPLLVASPLALSTALSALSHASVIGIDVEAASERVCTIQLASCDASIVVDVLSLDPAEVRAALEPLFAGPVVKLLHGCANDLAWLASLGLRVASPFLDTQVLALHLGAPASLSALVSLHCDAETRAALADKARLQRIDWSARPIEPDALAYAAADARCLLSVAAALVCSSYGGPPPPNDLSPLPQLLELALLRSDALALRGRAARASRALGGAASPAAVPSPTAAARDALKQARAAQIFTPRATPLYSNVLLLADDGVTEMARIDRSKALWYVEHGVAVVMEPSSGDSLGCDAALPAGVAGGPLLRVRMLQTPKGLGHAGEGADAAFHLAPRTNECVVCGASWAAALGQLVRCYIVPRAFKRHLPFAAKSYSSVDVVLCCTGCHRRADVAAGALLKRLAREFGVSLSTRSVSEDEDGNALVSRVHLWRRSAVALLRCGAPNPPQLPPDRISTLLLSLAHAGTVEALGVLAAAPVAAAAAAAAAADSAYAGVWRDVILATASPAAVAAVAASALRHDHVAFLASSAVLEAVAALAAAELPASATGGDDDDCAASGEGGGAGAAPPPFDPVGEIMRLIYEGGAPWQRAAAHFPLCAPPATTVTGLAPATEARLEALVRRFRATFVAAVRPTAMPTGWSVQLRVLQPATRSCGKPEPALLLAQLEREGGSRVSATAAAM